MLIIIYSKNEVLNLKSQNFKKIEEICPKVNDACPEKELKTINENENKQEKSEATDTKISINKATVKELQKLDGIGESKAEAIVKYRENNGEFKKIEDIKNVSGIGDSAFEKIKDKITL